MSDSDETVENKPEQEQPLPPAWTCSVKVFDKEPSAPLEKLYVGDKYLLKCEGEFVEGASAKWKLVPAEESEAHKVHILDYRTVENQQFWAEATSYRPGPIDIKAFYWSDGVTKIPLEGSPLTVQSALQERPPEVINNPESQKMLLYGPFALSMPLWYWLMWGAVVLLVCGVAYRWISKKLQRKKILENLARQSTALTPYNQFQKEVRQQMREYTSGAITPSVGANYLTALDDSFRMYLLRELLVPAKDWGSGAVMREIKSRHKKVYRSVGPQVRRTLVEFDRAKRDLDAVSLDDCEQMREMSRRVVDKLYKIKRIGR